MENLDISNPSCDHWRSWFSIHYHANEIRKNGFRSTLNMADFRCNFAPTAVMSRTIVLLLSSLGSALWDKFRIESEYLFATAFSPCTVHVGLRFVFLIQGDLLSAGMWLNFNFYSERCSVGHFRVLLCLCFKTSLSAKPFIWKWVLNAVSFSCKTKSFS